jgi:site-specific recombinase XerD
MRHRRVTTWLAVGTDAMKVKEPMGHADLRTTMDYTHLMWENLRGLVESGKVLGRFREDSAGTDAKES